MSNSATATLNIRLPQDLKEHGLQVLDREGVSTSEAVRGLFRLLDKEQCVPGWVTEGEKTGTFEQRRRLVREIASIAPINDDLSLEEIKYERTSRYFTEQD